MAARLNPKHQDSVRQKIQAIRLIEELQRHIDGERDMSSTQLRAVEILLNKSISNAPTDSNVNLFGEMSLKTVERRIVDPTTPNT